jgi:hypothetical protein
LPGVAHLFEAVRGPSIRLFLDEYRRLPDLGPGEFEPWRAPIATRTLAVDGITGHQTRQLIEEVA